MYGYLGHRVGVNGLSLIALQSCEDPSVKTHMDPYAMANGLSCLSIGMGIRSQMITPFHPYDETYIIFPVHILMSNVRKSLLCKYAFKGRSLPINPIWIQLLGVSWIAVEGAGDILLLTHTPTFFPWISQLAQRIELKFPWAPHWSSPTDHYILQLCLPPWRQHPRRSYW